MNNAIRFSARDQLTDEKLPLVLNDNPFIRYSWDAWIEMMNEDDALWCFQDSKALMDMQPFGRKEFIKALNAPKFEFIASKGNELSEYSYKVAEVCREISKPFDVMIEYPEITERQVYIDVPKTVKTGLFKKETIYEKQIKKEPVISNHSLTFAGWRLDRFWRKCIEQDESTRHVSILSWDYCLGSDGKLYLLNSKYGWGGFENDPNNFFPNKPEFTVDELIPFQIQVLNYKNQNIFIGAFCGLTFVLDAIPIGNRNESSLNHRNGIYRFNFPLQINDFQENPYGIGEGLLLRLKNLIT